VIPDRLHQLGTFCALTPLRDPDAADAELQSWERGSGSPMARLGFVHFTRFVVLDPLLRRADAAQPAEEELGPYLMFSAFFDGDAHAFLVALCDALPDEAAAVWSHCAGYPGSPRDDGHAFRAWLEEHRVPATAVFGAYPEATLPEVQRALKFRERFREQLAFGLDDQRRMQKAFAEFDAQEGQP
jgi:hypothetical protein